MMYLTVKVIPILLVIVQLTYCPYDVEAGIAAYRAKPLTLSFIGDVMVHGPQLTAARQADGSYQFDGWFNYMRAELSRADLTIANLETTISQGPSYTSYPRFRSPKSLITSLKRAGIDVLSTANNHSLDGLLDGVITTLNTIDEQQLLSVGTSRPSETTMPLILEKKGIKLGLIASTYGTNGLQLSADTYQRVNVTNQFALDEQLKWLKDQGVDGIIYFIHWGNEYQRSASRAQRELAHALADKGIDFIIGSHPHVMQTEAYIESGDKTSYVLYSLGNAISNQRWRYSDSGLLLTLSLKKNQAGQLVMTKRQLTPFWVDKYDAKGAIDFAMLPLNQARSLARVSADDRIKMSEALSDFQALFPDENNQ